MNHCWSQARTAASVGEAILRASAQVRAHSGAGLSQPRCNAGHHSPTRSDSHPGRSDQFAATQRERERVSAGLDGAGAAGGAATVGALSSTGGGGASSGADEHAASTPRIAAGPILRATRGNDITMWLILLEALGALVILVLIVWWTMFSGRKGGERKGRDDQ